MTELTPEWLRWNESWRKGDATARARRAMLAALSNAPGGLSHQELAAAARTELGGLADDSIRCSTSPGAAEWDHRIRDAEIALRRVGRISFDEIRRRYSLNQGNLGKSSRYGVDWTRRDLLYTLRLYQTPAVSRDKSGVEVRQLADRLGRTPDSISMKLHNFESIDPAVGKTALPNASRLDRELFNAFASRPSAVSEEISKIEDPGESYAGRAGRDEGDAENGALDSRDSSKESFRVEDDTAPSKVRKKQGRFSRIIRMNYEGRCAFCGLDVDSLLVASHIKPWADDPDNRLNPANGILLCATHDRAFDRGLISLDGQLRILISAELDNAESDAARTLCRELEGGVLRAPKADPPAADFVWYHRTAIFLG